MGLSVLAVQMKTFASFPLRSSMKSNLDDLSCSAESPSLEVTKPAAPFVRSLELRSWPHRSDLTLFPANAHAARKPRKGIQRNE